MNNIFPAIANPTKMSTAMCATVFEELEDALDLLNVARNEFNPLQRQLAGRFIALCKVFGRDLLAADGNPDALRAMFGLPITGRPASQADVQIAGAALIDEVCTGLCRDLEKIEASVQGELLEGLADVVADIRAGRESESPEGEVLDAMASSVRDLAHQVAALFAAQQFALRRHQLVYQDNVESPGQNAESAPRLTVDEFMQRVKPPVRRATVRERLEPFIPQLVRLRQQGYSYAQCTQFLRENGVDTYPAAISSVLATVRE